MNTNDSQEIPRPIMELVNSVTAEVIECLAKIAALEARVKELEKQNSKPRKIKIKIKIKIG